MTILDEGWTTNGKSQNTLTKGHFVGFVEDGGTYWVEYNHSDGSPRVIAKGRNYRGTEAAMIRVEKELRWVLDAVEKRKQRGKLNAKT